MRREVWRAKGCKVEPTWTSVVVVTRQRNSGEPDVWCRSGHPSSCSSFHFRISEKETTDTGTTLVNVCNNGCSKTATATTSYLTKMIPFKWSLKGIKKRKKNLFHLWTFLPATHEERNETELRMTWMTERRKVRLSSFYLIQLIKYLKH